MSAEEARAEAERRFPAFPQGYPGEGSRQFARDSFVDGAEWQASREVTDAQPQWADTLVNDGEYEYTSSGDCDGSNVKYWRRRPRFVIEYTAWEPSSSEAHDAALEAAREVQS